MCTESTSVRSHKMPNADIEAGYSLSIVLGMTIAAVQTGRRVTLDDALQEVIVSRFSRNRRTAEKLWAETGGRLQRDERR